RASTGSLSRDASISERILSATKHTAAGRDQVLRSQCQHKHKTLCKMAARRFNPPSGSSQAPTGMDRLCTDFETNEELRSAFIREITLLQLKDASQAGNDLEVGFGSIPRRLIRYWHDPSDLPRDVSACLASWNGLADAGFEFFMFDDVSGAAYIADNYG